MSPRKNRRRKAKNRRNLDRWFRGLHKPNRARYGVHRIRSVAHMIRIFGDPHAGSPLTERIQEAVANGDNVGLWYRGRLGDLVDVVIEGTEFPGQGIPVTSLFYPTVKRIEPDGSEEE